MAPVWLIEADVYGTEISPLLDSIRRQGLTAEVVPHRALHQGIFSAANQASLGPEACVLGYGTYPFAQQIQLHHEWTPGAWCSAENFECPAYFAHFGRFLLNQNYRILPGFEALRLQDRVFSDLERDGRVFVRPTTCLKLFTGRCVDREEFADSLAFARYDHSVQVVVAAPQAVEREWRLIIVGDEIISGSQYSVAGKRTIAPGVPDEVRQFAYTILEAVPWRPDPAFMLDVCESAGRLWIVELNSFSGSWLYQADFSAVVEAASALAARLWHQNSEQNGNRQSGTQSDGFVTQSPSGNQPEKPER